MSNRQRTFSFLIAGIVLFGCNKTQRDSSKIDNQQVEIQLNNRMDYFIKLYGSKENLEKAAGKTMDEIKAENRQFIKEQMMEQQISPTKNSN